MAYMKTIPIIIPVSFTKDELETAIYIMDDWRTIKSDQRIGVTYPNNSTTSTRLITKLYEIFKNLT